MVLLTRKGKDCDSEGLLHREKVFCKPYKNARRFSQPMAAAGTEHLEVKDVLQPSSSWTYHPHQLSPKQVKQVM